MTRCKFPSLHRLTQSSDFDAVFKETAFRESRKAFLCLAKPNQRGFNRLGIIVGKKHIPAAVDRNRVKRRIREAFRCSPENGTGFDVLVLARPAASGQEKLMEEVMEVLQKMSVKAAG